MKSVADSMLIRCEVYNPHKFKLHCRIDESKLIYIRASGITEGFRFKVIEPDSFVLLNHQYYRITFTNSNEPAAVVVNFGDMIGIGNKQPSRPDFELRDGGRSTHSKKPGEFFS